MGEVTDGLHEESTSLETSSKGSQDEGPVSGLEPAAISLEDLRRAFEDAMQLPKTEPTTSPDLSDNRDQSRDGDGADRSVPVTPASIVEALLFVGSPLQSGLSMSVLEDILHGMSIEEIEKTISELNESYRRFGHPWHIVRDGDLCSLQLLESVESALDRLQSVPRDTLLSQNSIDCLSLVAYRPGISKGELESLWGQSAGATLGYLVKKGLVRFEEEPGSRESRYFTTVRFLEILGIQTLDDLPQGDEL